MHRERCFTRLPYLAVDHWQPSEHLFGSRILNESTNPGINEWWRCPKPKRKTQQIIVPGFSLEQQRQPKKTEYKLNDKPGTSRQLVLASHRAPSRYLWNCYVRAHRCHGELRFCRVIPRKTQQRMTWKSSNIIIYWQIVVPKSCNCFKNILTLPVTCPSHRLHRAPDLKATKAWPS